jgi:hypothetical protein
MRKALGQLVQLKNDLSDKTITVYGTTFDNENRQGEDMQKTILLRWPGS